MTDKWYVSKRVWAAFFMIAALVAGVFGLDIDTETQAKLTDHVVELVTVVSAAIAAVLALYSKWKESRK